MQTASNSDLLATFAAFLQQFPGGEMLFTILMFVLVLGVLVFVHEWGHYAAARSVGIRVTAFSIGFGKAFARWTDKHGTRWQLAWLPLGGYVQLHGQEDGKAYGAETDPDAFGSKSVPARMWVIFAGPLANIVFAALLLTLVMLTGDHKLRAEVGDVLPNMPAAGVLMRGDTIQSVDGRAVTEWDDVQKYVETRAGQPVTMVVARPQASAQAGAQAGTPAGGPTQQLTFTLTPQTTTFTDLLGDTHTVGRLGFAPSYNTFVVQHGPLMALTEGVSRTWELTSLTVKSLYKLIIGAISPDNLTGPLGIADMAGQTAANGLFAVLMFMAIISINLGIVNLVPLPILDGGHLVFLSYEALRGRPLSAKVQEISLRVGLVLIVMLALFATMNDLKRFGLVSWLRGDSAENTEAAAAPAAAPAPAAEAAAGTSATPATGQ